MQFNPRYAIYYAPHPDTAFARLGASALGYDAQSGTCVPYPPALTRAIRNWPEIVAQPARYGFHATLKAPFELRQGEGESNLLDAVRALALLLRPLDIGILEPEIMGSFIAMVPSDQTTIRPTVARIVTELDHLRAPLSESDRKRRLEVPLSDTQTKYLDQWGYPYVFDEYRFHMTLTGSLVDAAHRATVGVALQQLFLAIRAPVIVDALTVFRQQERATPFTAIARFEMMDRTR